MKQKWDPLGESNTANPEDCYLTYFAWRWCVEHYSECHPEDKMVALAGVARIFGQALQSCGESGTYLCGLWEDRLLSQLMWRYRDTEKNGKRLSTYRAPSWSWASVDGAVSFLEAPGAEDIYLCKLVSHSVLASYDPFGAITAGQIRVCSPLIRVNLKLKDEVRPGGSVSGTSAYFHASAQTVPNSRFKCDIYLDDQLSSNLSQTVEVHAFTISRSKYGEHLVGLILQLTTSPGNTADRPRGSFVRIGTFSMKKSISRFLEVGTRFKDPDLVYEEANGMGRYTISIL